MLVKENVCFLSKILVGILNNFFLCTKRGCQKPTTMYKPRVYKGCAAPCSAKPVPKEGLAYMEIFSSRDILV